MIVFGVVIVIAAVLGGFVGGEITDRLFSVTGAVVGGITVASVFLALGAYFDAQDRERKKELPPEIRDVFARLLGKGKPLPPPISREPRRVGGIKSDTLENQYLFVVSSILTAQVVSSDALKGSFGWLMTNKRGAGYIFGVHDALIQRLRPLKARKERIPVLIELSYRNIFGEQAGHALFSRSLQSQEDSDFMEGRMVGGNDLVNYFDNKVPPFGLCRILLGSKS